MLEEYHADLAKYAQDDCVDDEYEDGEVEHSSGTTINTKSSNGGGGGGGAGMQNTSTSSPTGPKRRPSGGSNGSSRLIKTKLSDQARGGALALLFIYSSIYLFTTLT
jgi:hypothetical protein